MKYWGPLALYKHPPRCQNAIVMDILLCLGIELRVVEVPRAWSIFRGRNTIIIIGSGV